MKEIETETIFACTCCGVIETEPFDFGDECKFGCGGKFQLYTGEIKLIADIKFAKDK